MKKILIINNSLDPKNRDFVNPILNHIKMGKIVHFSKVTNSIVQEYKSIILSGAPISDRDILHQRIKHYSWLTKYERPILGICAGHQIIGLTFGSTKIHEKETGYCEILLDNNDLIFKDITFPFQAYEHHTDSITLPKDFILLAHSKKCRVEVMKHKFRTIYGIEFHPEKSQTKLLENFVTVI